MKVKLLLSIIIIIFSVAPFACVESSAQGTQFDINSVDITKIKVDEISDDQIRQLMEKAAESGIPQQQIETALTARGMSQSELQKLRMRMSTVKVLGVSKKQGTAVGYTRDAAKTQKRTDLKPEDILSSIFTAGTDSLTPTYDPRERIFGYSLFNTQDLTFEPSINLPTPSNYLIGPGDEINIDVWGASEQNYTLVVSPDGFIIVENIGPILLNNLTVEEATKKITTRFSSIYAGLRGQNPNTYVQVSLGNLRSIKVVLLGEVYLPGSYTLSSLASAFNALYLSGGPNINGSLRKIDIIRDNHVINSIDVYDFLFKGDITSNIRLNDQDIIKINPYSIRVKVAGEVKRPLIYEMKPNEVLSDLIRFAGGFSDKAYTYRLKIIRNTSREKLMLDVPATEYNDFLLQNGDSVIVEPILERFANRVEIKGAVYRPGEYAINDSLTLLNLIEKAEGITGDAFMSRAVIYRTMEDYNLETIPVDLTALMNGSFQDIPLKREDIVNIPSIFDLQEEYYVQIDGEVRNPGRFPFMYNSTVEDIILQAGGFLESASMARLEVARRVKDAQATTTSNKVADIFYYQISKDLKLSNEGSRLVLEPFDRIFIRRSPGYENQLTASIEGEILFPGEYSISNKNERISDLVNRSGGLTADAYPKGASLIRIFPIAGSDRIRALRLGKFAGDPNLESSRTLLNSLPGRGVDRMKEIEDKKMQVIDSIIGTSASLNDVQAIGIDLEKILAQPHSKFDLIIQEGDLLKVPKVLQTVTLSGAVLHPISVRYDKRYSLKDYARSAGGFSPDAKRSKSYVLYANGSADITRSVIGIKNYPKVEPGAEIIVPVRKERKGVTAGELVSLGSALTSMALLVVTLMNTLK